MRSVNKFLLLFTVFYTGCIDTDLISDPQASRGEVVITSSINSVLVDDTEILTAKLSHYPGLETPCAAVTWTSTNTGIASINADGALTGISKGQAYITASAPYFKTDSLLVTVVDDTNSVSEILVTADSSSVRRGNTIQLKAEAYNINGNALPGNQFAWSVSDNTVLKVNDSGLATALAPGTATVTATTGNVSSVPFSISVLGAQRTGTFVKNPSQDHVVSGTATLKENNEGSLSLEFGADFASSGGPDIRVYFSATNALTGDIFEVGQLKSTGGAQIYDIPPGIKINDYDYIIIHCVPFNVTFGWAHLN